LHDRHSRIGGRAEIVPGGKKEDADIPLLL
jgi:hypothetical protein